MSGSYAAQSGLFQDHPVRYDWAHRTLFRHRNRRAPGISLVPNVYQNFGLCLFFTTLIVPAWYLARWHAANSDA